MISRRLNRRLALLGLGTIVMALGVTPVAFVAVAQQEGGVAAWRVECTGDGKTLDCRAIQQMFNRDDKQLVVQLAARGVPEKSPTLTMNLPLGISLTEPVQLKGRQWRSRTYQVQTCANTGCIVSVPLKDPLLAAMRTGTLLKITMQAPDKRTLNVEVPLLGFGLAYDKAK